MGVYALCDACRSVPYHRAHWRSSHWHRGQYFSHFWLGYGKSIYSYLSLLTIYFVPFILFIAYEISYHWHSGEPRSPDLGRQRDQDFDIVEPLPLHHVFLQRLPYHICGNGKQYL